MLSTRPHLTTLRPSPSTVSYTVSSASPRQTLPSRLLHYLGLLFRMLLGFATLLALSAKGFDTSSAPSFFRPLVPLSEYLAEYPWVQIAPLALTSLFLVFRRFHTGKSSSSSLLKTQHPPPPPPPKLETTPINNNNNKPPPLPPAIHILAYLFF